MNECWYQTLSIKSKVNIWVEETDNLEREINITESQYMTTNKKEPNKNDETRITCKEQRLKVITQHEYLESLITRGRRCNDNKQKLQVSATV